MATTEKYTTVIELNSEQAKRNLDDLRKQVESWKSDLAEAREKKMGKSFIAAIRKELREAENELKKYDSEVARTIDTLKNIGSASVEQIENAQKTLTRLSKEVPHDSALRVQLGEQLEQVTQELENIKATKAFEQLQKEAAGATKAFEQTRAEAEFVKQTVDNIDTASLKQLKLAEQTAKNIKESAQQGSLEYNGAATSLDKIRAKLSDIDATERKVVTTADQYNQAMKSIHKEEKQVANETELIERTLKNMSSASIRDIEFSIKALKEQIQDTERSGGQVEELTNKLKQLNAELRKVQDMQRPDEKRGNIFSRFIDGLNKNWGAITQIFAGITQLSMTVRGAVQDFADMEEEMADVRKYTGLTADQVRELNEELKRMDTRTRREELNQLAGAAGRLGITAKEDILEFVDAADKIGVALGDDLGQGAVDKIGKLAMAFGEDDRLGLRGAMLATGSAINELAQNSSAQAGFLVDFTARVAGFAKQIGLTQAQLMGFGTVMDENLLQDEMAATAFGNMLTKMQTDTEKFARIAGMDLKAFTDLMRNDANQAVLALADSLRQADPTTMMKMLDDMGLDGARATAVLATMADKIDDVRRHQELAKAAYEEGTSVQGEFATMNETVQAKIDKCKKRFQEMSIELGEKLLPVVQYTITSGSLLVKVLSTVTSFVLENKGAIASAAAGIVAYTVYVKAATIANKAYEVATKAMTLATELFNKATKMNPIGVLIAVLTVAVGLFIRYRDRINGATEATNLLRRAGASLMNVLAQVTGWFISLVKWAASLYDRFTFLRKIVQLLVTSFTVAFSTIANQAKMLLDILGGVANVIEGMFTLDWDKIKAGYKQGFKAIGDAAIEQFNIIKRGIRDVFSAPPTPNGGSNAATPANSPSGKPAAAAPAASSTGSTAYKSVAEEKQEAKEQRKREAERKRLEAERKRRLKEAEDAAKAESDAAIAAKTHEYSMGRISYREYIRDMARLQQEALEKRRDVYEKGSTEYEKLNRQLEERIYKGDEQVNRMRLEDLQRDMLRQQAAIEGAAAREEITEQEKQERLRLLNETFLADKVELYRKGTKERMDAEWELEQAEQRNKQERERQYQEQLRQVRLQYLGETDERARQLALKNLDELHAQGLLKEREYQEARRAIEMEYAVNPKDKTKQKADAMLKHAEATAAPAGSDLPIVGTVQKYQSVMEQLRTLYADDQQNHEAYLLAKQQATAQFCQTLASEMQAAYNTVNQVMQAAANYFSAQQDYEVAQVKAKYDKQIEAAGNNQKKVKKLQEKQQKEEAAIKTKYAKRAATIQMAQAVAQTAIAAINAYSSAAAIPVTGHILAPIAAAAAVAAGMLQIATIKKQQQAQEAGYYEGGFTGGRRYRREAGVVHEGEFVANHQAVNNPAITPFLNFIDQAQRNNTVGSLSMQDVSRSMGAGGAAQVVAPIVNVQTDNEQLNNTLLQVLDTQERLASQLEQGIGVDIPIDGENGVYRQLKRYEQLLKNK